MGLDIYIYFSRPEDEDSPKSNRPFDALAHGPLQVLMFRYNKIMSETFSDVDIEITREYLIKTIAQLTERSSQSEDDWKSREIAETILFCAYLLKEDDFPVWVNYSP